MSPPRLRASALRSQPEIDDSRNQNNSTISTLPTMQPPEDAAAARAGATSRCVTLGYVVTHGATAIARAAAARALRSSRPRPLARGQLALYSSGAFLKAIPTIRRGPHDQVRQVQTAQPPCDRRARTRAAPVLLLCDGHDRGGDSPAAGRRGHLLERGRARATFRSAVRRRPSRWASRSPRHPARIHHHHRHRRHRDGPRGDALFAGLARGDCRHGRTDHARPLL